MTSEQRGGEGRGERGEETDPKLAQHVDQQRMGPGMRLDPFQSPMSEPLDRSRREEAPLVTEEKEEVHLPRCGACLYLH